MTKDKRYKAPIGYTDIGYGRVVYGRLPMARMTVRDSYCLKAYIDSLISNATEDAPVEDGTLKPCPFCGAPAEFVEYHPEDGWRTEEDYVVCCTGKGYHQLDYISDKQDLMKVWNERAPTQEPPK